MAISIPALITSGEMPAVLGNKILLARGQMTGHWPNILESAILYANARAWTATVADFASDEVHDINELLGTFGLRFGERDRLSHAELQKLMRAYETEDLLLSWDKLPKHITRDSWNWNGDPDVHLYTSIPSKKGFNIELELRFSYATDEYADDGWLWTIVNNSKGIYASRHREGLGAGVPERFIDIEDAFEDLHRTYEKIRRFSTGEVTAKHVEAKPAPAPKPKPASKPKPRGKRPVEFVPRRARKRHVKPATEQDVLRQAVEFGDIPAFPEYEQTISKLVRKKHLQASATEPGAYHITAAGIRALPEKNPQKDRYQVKVVGTMFSLPTGEEPAKQTLTIEAGSHDEARKKAASRMVERAELMGYEFSGRHKDFKSKKMNPRRKKPKRNAHIPVQRGREKIPTTGRGFAFIGIADVYGEDDEPFDEKVYMYTYRKDPQYFVALIPIDLSIKMGEFGGLRRWSGRPLPQWIVEIGIGDTKTATPYMRLETIETGTVKEAFEKTAEIIGKDKRAPKKKIQVSQRRFEIAEGHATGSNPKKKAKASGPDHRTGKPRKRKVHQAFSKWTDAQKMAKKHPDTFDAPDLDELKRDVKIGDYVKWNIGAERMWLLVVDVEGDTITGLLSNYPLDERYQMDDVVRIKFKHVYDYKKGDKKSLERAEAFLDELVEKAKSIKPKKKAKKKTTKKKAARKKNPARSVKRTINRGLIHRWIGDNDIGKHTLYDPKQMGKHHITPSSTAVAVMNVEDGDFLPRAMADIYEEDWAIELLAQFTMFLKSAGYQWQPVKDDETGMWYEVVKRERGNPAIGERKGRPGWRKPQPGWALLMIAAGVQNQLHEWSREAPVLERAGMIERKRGRYGATRKGLETLYRDYPDFIVSYEEMRSAHPEEDWKPLPLRPNPKAKKKTTKKKTSKKNPRDPNDPILKWFPIGKKLQGALSIIRKPDKTEWRMWRIADAYSTSDGWSVYLDTLTIRTLMLAGHAPSRHSMEGGGAIDNIRIIIRKKGNKAIVTVPDNPAHYHVYKSLTISVKPGEDPYGVVASAIVWFGEKADRIPPVDDYDREELISAVASNWRKARGSGRVANFPHARVIVRNLLGEWRSFPRSENPAKAKKKIAKKASKKKTSKKKETLIGKAHRLWDEYYEKPTKKALKSVLDHLEDMERSTGKRVRAEWRKAKRSARAEAKRLGVKV